MPKYLNPKNDLTFKKVYGEHPDLLISLLNALLPLPEGESVTAIEYLTPELVPEIPTRKDSVVDVRCKDSSERRFVVEMQMYWSKDFFKRAMFNTAKAYVKPPKPGDKYDEIPPIYSLNLIADTIYPDDKNYYHHYLPTEKGNPEHIIEDFELVFIELPKFALNPDIPTERPRQQLWLRFLTEIDEDTRQAPEELSADKEIAQALQLLEESSYTEGQMLTYERYWDIIRRERSLYATGKQQGERIGQERGERIGQERGEKIGQERERVARDAFWHDILRRQGYTDEDITRIITQKDNTKYL